MPDPTPPTEAERHADAAGAVILAAVIGSVFYGAAGLLGGAGIVLVLWGLTRRETTRG